jgi:hypothetical protein
MTSARTRLRFVVMEIVERVDVPEMREHSAASEEGFYQALQAVRNRRDDATPKRGALTGALSTRFSVGPEDLQGRGRIIYSVDAVQITVWAAFHEHDEAYRRARRRYRASAPPPQR